MLDKTFDAVVNTFRDFKNKPRRRESLTHPDTHSVSEGEFSELTGLGGEVFHTITRKSDSSQVPTTGLRSREQSRGQNTRGEEVITKANHETTEKRKLWPGLENLSSEAYQILNDPLVVQMFAKKEYGNIPEDTENYPEYIFNGYILSATKEYPAAKNPIDPVGGIIYFGNLPNNSLIRLEGLDAFRVGEQIVMIPTEVGNALESAKKANRVRSEKYPEASLINNRRPAANLELAESNSPIFQNIPKIKRDWDGDVTDDLQKYEGEVQVEKTSQADFKNEEHGENKLTTDRFGDDWQKDTAGTLDREQTEETPTEDFLIGKIGEYSKLLFQARKDYDRVRLLEQNPNKKEAKIEIDKILLRYKEFKSPYKLLDIDSIRNAIEKYELEERRALFELQYRYPPRDQSQVVRGDEDMESASLDITKNSAEPVIETITESQNRLNYDNNQEETKLIKWISTRLNHAILESELTTVFTEATTVDDIKMLLEKFRIPLQEREELLKNITRHIKNVESSSHEDPKSYIKKIFKWECRHEIKILKKPFANVFYTHPNDYKEISKILNSDESTGLAKSADGVICIKGYDINEGAQILRHEMQHIIYGVLNKPKRLNQKRAENRVVERLGIQYDSEPISNKFSERRAELDHTQINLVVDEIIAYMTDGTLSPDLTKILKLDLYDYNIKDDVHAKLKQKAGISAMFENLVNTLHGRSTPQEYIQDIINYNRVADRRNYFKVVNFLIRLAYEIKNKINNLYPEYDEYKINLITSSLLRDTKYDNWENLLAVLNSLTKKPQPLETLGTDTTSQASETPEQMTGKIARAEQNPKIDYQNMTREQAKQAEDQNRDEYKETSSKLRVIKVALQNIKSYEAQIADINSKLNNPLSKLIYGEQKLLSEKNDLQTRINRLVEIHSVDGGVEGVAKKITEYEEKLAELGTITKTPQQSSYI
jgi:hypothetical protein